MLVVPDNMVSRSESPDLILSQKAEKTCKTEGINYKDLEPIQRLFLTIAVLYASYCPCIA